MQKTGYSMFPSETSHPFFQNWSPLNRSNTIKLILLTYLGKCVKAKFVQAGWCLIPKIACHRSFQHHAGANARIFGRFGGIISAKRETGLTWFEQALRPRTDTYPGPNMGELGVGIGIGIDRFELTDRPPADGLVNECGSVGIAGSQI
jgi:hypothetical protein